MVLLSRSLMPKMAPTAKAPAATLSTASRVRVLLCQRSNQTLYQMTPMLDLHFPTFDVFLLVDVGGLVQRLAGGLRLTQQLVELIVTEGKDLDRAALAGPDGSMVAALMEERHLSEVFAGSELQRD